MVIQGTPIMEEMTNKFNKIYDNLVNFRKHETIIFFKKKDNGLESTR